MRTRLYRKVKGDGGFVYYDPVLRLDVVYDPMNVDVVDVDRYSAIGWKLWWVYAIVNGDVLDTDAGKRNGVVVPSKSDVDKMRSMWLEHGAK